MPERFIRINQVVRRSESQVKQVLMIAYYFPPCAASGIYRTLRFSKYLPEYGWKPLILTLKENLYEHDCPIDRTLVDSIPNDLMIVRTTRIRFLERLLHLKSVLHPKKTSSGIGGQRTKETTTPSLWQRLKDIITRALTTPDQQIGWFFPALFAGLKSVREDKIDAIYSTASPWTAHLVAYWLHKLTGIPWVADFRDPWTQNPWQLERSRIRRSIENRMEKSVVKAANSVIANTQALREDFIRRFDFLDSEKVVALTNGFDPNGHHVNARPCMANPEVFTLTHTGALYAERDPQTLFQALSELICDGSIPGDKARVNLVGQNDEKVETTLSQYKELMEVVRLIPPVSHSESFEYLLASDVLLIVQPKTRLQIPAKIYEYIQVGKRILALTPYDGATGRLVKSEKFGIVVEPDDIPKLKAELLDLYHSFCTGNLCANKNGSARDRYSMKSITRELAGILNQVGSH